MTELTYAQHGVWFTEQAGAAGGSYQMAMGIRFGEGLNEKALDVACAAVIERHSLLSAAVTIQNGAPALTPAPELVSLAYGEWSDDRVAGEIARSFDLSTGPLARFTLLTAAPDRHLLLIVAHHLIFDGVSKDVLAHDLALAYGGALSGQPAFLGPQAWPAPGPTPTASDLAMARDYWQRHWSPPGSAALPDHLGVPVTAGPGGNVTVSVPPELVSRLEAATQRLGLTRFELLLAVIHVVLTRYGNAGLPVSVALSTRDSRTARQLGLFVNELPVTIAAAEGTFADYARALRDRLRELYRIRAVPLAQAVSGLRPAAALTPVSVSYRRQEADPTFTGVATSIDWSMPSGAARNALNLLIVDAPAELRINLQHSNSALPAAAAERIGAHLITVLGEVAEDGEKALVDLAILPPAEQDLILHTWNATTRPLPAAATVLSLFGEQVRAKPDAPAVLDAGLELSYADLDVAVTRLAGHLRDAGVQPGALVAVSLHRSWQAVVTLLAIMRCGAAYVPADPSYPEARRALILADAAPALTINDPRFADAAPGAGPGLAAPALTAGVPVVIDAGAGPDPRERAYIMYTSGSTGTPKGVCISHGALANLLLGMSDLLESRPCDRWLALTSLSFDISGLELFLPLVTGGTVVVASDVAGADGAAVSRLVREQRVTHVQATPSGWRVLLDGGFDSAVTALAGGEVLTPALARELRPRVARLFNVYGPTETTIWSTAEELAEEIDQVTIGKPIANTRAYVLDDALHPVPIGIAGELYLAGNGVADGYLHRPELTAERFIDSGWGRLYRTGDRCQWTPDGRLLYVGRIDNQVKLRGHRIELGEIEARLREQSTVADAAVILRGSGDSACLAAYVVLRPGNVMEPAGLRDHLARTLPAIMVPVQWMALDRLPLTPNGKLDRAALPEPPQQRSAPAADSQAGNDEIVLALQAIWQDVLQIQDISPDDDLFDLGGHSLSITRIAGRIHQRFQVEVPLTTFFETPTLAEIADVVRESIRRSEH